VRLRSARPNDRQTGTRAQRALVHRHSGVDRGRRSGPGPRRRERVLALGGTALLDTIGGDIERWGRERGASVVAALWAIAVLKAVVAFAARVVAIRPAWLPSWTAGQAPRILSWIAAVILALHGGLLTVAGLAIELDVVSAAGDADTRALAWHVYLWDPWFFLWGVAFIVALWFTRPPRATSP
jgi:hypothetical protein